MKRFIKKHLLILMTIFLYICISLPLKFSDHHLLFNLEPYPDSFGYLTPVSNFVNGKGFVYEYNGYVIPQRMPPLYSIVLIPLYVLINHPISFYFSNILLGVFALVGLDLLLKKITKKNWLLVFTGLVLYLAHGYIFLVASTPMAENLILPLFIWALNFYFEKKGELKTKNLLMAGFCVVGLLMTKYSYFVVALVLGLMFIVRLFSEKNWKRVGIFLLGSFFWIGTLLLYLSYLNWSSFKFVESISPFSLEYIKKGFDFYSKVILGGKTNFLWFNSSLTSIIFLIVIILVVALFWKIKKNNEKIFFIKFGLIYLSHFPLLLVYFYLDARFVVSIIVINILFFVKFLDNFIKKEIFKVFIFIVLMASLLFSQKNLYKQVLSQNWLGNTRAWQYEAVKEIGEYAKKYDNSYFVTALHPPLFDIYGFRDIKLLPLSAIQEYHQDKIWGEINMPIEDEITNLLEKDQKVLISNAYVNAHSDYASSFESLKEKFVFKIEQEGCLNTCNIYSVSLIY